MAKPTMTNQTSPGASLQMDFSTPSTNNLFFRKKRPRNEYANNDSGDVGGLTKKQTGYNAMNGV